MRIKGPWGAPYPITYSGLATAFSEYGGSGATLGLIIAMLIFLKKLRNQRVSLRNFLWHQDYSISMKWSYLDYRSFESDLYHSIYLAPLVNIMIGYTAVMVLKIMPPVTIGVPWTAPGPLMPFLGTGGNITALFVGFICLAVSVLIYSPFVIAANKAAVLEEEAENEISAQEVTRINLDGNVADALFKK